MSFLSSSLLDHSSFANCSKSFRFVRCFLPTAVLRSFHRCSIGFRSGFIAGHFRTLQRFVCNHFGVLFEVCYVSLCCHWPMTSGGDAAFWHWTLHSTPKFFGNHQISWYHSHSQGIQCQKQQSNPKTYLNLHHVWLCSFLWRPHFFFCKQCHDVLYQKALLLSRLSTVLSHRRIVVLSHTFWQTPVLLFYAFVSAVVSSRVSYHSVPFHSDGDG